MGRDKKKSEVPVSVYVEAKKRYLEQLQQILTPRLYEGFESLYDDALELLENEFEERKEQTKSILKTFQDALREIPIWNQDIIEHESDRIIQVSNCDYLDDLIDALFRAESKILTSVQTIKSSKPLKVKVPLASHFIHRCYICAAREIFKNPFVFNHFKELTPRDKQNNLREAIFMINEGITNAVRELLPIRDILKNSMKAGEYSGTESDNSSLSGTDSDYDSDESEESRRHKKHSKKHREEEESESSSSSESDEESIEEPTSELKVQGLESEGGSSSIQTSSEEIKNLNEDEDEDEEESSEDDEEDNSEEGEDSSEDEELVQHLDEEIENVNNIEMKEELKEENQIVNTEKENNGFIGGLINNFIGSGNDNTIKLEDMGENVETQNSNEENEPIEIKKIVFEGTKIPKEYRIQEESQVLEKIQEPALQQFEQSIIKQVEEPIIKQIEETVQQVSEPIIKEEVNHVPVEDNRSGGMILTLDELKRREKKMRKEKEQREREKEMLKFKKPYPITQQKNRDENMLSLIQRKRELYYKQINPEDQQSVISTGKMSISSSKGLTPDNRVKMIDNFLNQNKEEVKKQLSINTQVEPKVISYMTPNIIKKVEEEDSGDEYQSDPELNA